MKKIIPLLLVVITFTACKNSSNNEVSATESTTIAKASFSKSEKAELTISGMTCAVGCAGTIQKNIAKIDGVQSVVVDFDNQLAMVEYNSAKLAVADLENIVHNTSEAYKVLDSKNVNAFQEVRPEETHHSKCTDDCEQDCCKNKKIDSEDVLECKENCTNSCCANKA